MSLRSLVLVCFFLSGATGLLYQVLWTRLLGGVIGNTHFSFTIVVSVFMGGLALGSWLGGRAAERSRNPLRLYGVLILAVGVLCLLVPAAIAAVRPLFAWLYQAYDGDPEAGPLVAARLVFCTLVLLGPTTCMGCTLPVLSQYLTTRMSNVGMSIGSLYTVNTFGAFVGAALTGFVALRALGLWGTTAVAVLADVAIGVVVIAASRGLTRTIAPPDDTGAATTEPAETAASSRARPRLPLDIRLAVWAFALTGFGNMMLQNAWIKGITQTIGNSTYAFSLIVTLFILGIGVGGAIMTPLVDRLKNLNLALGVVVALTGVAISATVPALGKFPVWGSRWFDSVDQPAYGAFLGIALAMVSLLILPSTILMGMVFPLVGKIRTRAVERVGSAVGSAYFANTFGSILGTLAAGFLFIPLFGRIYWTLYLGAAISLVVGLVLIGTALRGAKPIRFAIPLGLAALVLAAHFPLRPFGVFDSTSALWDPALLSRGPYVYFPGTYWKNRARREVLPEAEMIAAVRKGNEILWYHEGIHAPIAVVHNDTLGTALRISGKVDASLPPGGGFNNDLPHQVMAGHLPMLLHPAPKDVVTLGLGGGVTLGTLTLYDVDEIDSLEISPEVIEAARRFFGSANRGSLEPDHPKVRNVVGDGRNHLQFTPKKFDVITSVPSNPWIAGIGNLFTVEFFEICRDRLEPGGIVCQWIHKVNMRSQDLKTVVRTFTTVFDEHAQLWDLGYDCLMIGSADPIRLDAARFAKMLENDAIRSDLASLGVVDVPSFLRHYQFDARAMRRYAGRGPTNTDSYPILEFECPKGLYGHRYDAYFALTEAKHTELAADWIDGVSEGDLQRARSRQRAFHHYELVEVWNDQIVAKLKEMVAGGHEATQEQQQELLRLVRDKILASLKGLEASLREDHDEWLDSRAARVARKTLGVSSQTLREALRDWHLRIARAPEWQTQSFAAARLEKLEGAWEYGARDLQTALEIARTCLVTGARAKGIELLESQRAVHSDAPTLLQMLGVLYAADGRADKAEPLLQDALVLTAGDAKLQSEVHQNLGRIRLQASQFDEAEWHYTEALRLDPQNRNARAQLDALRKARAAGADGN